MKNTTNDFVSGPRASLAPVSPFGSGLFSIREAAAMTNTGDETIRRSIRKGLIPAFGTPGRLRVRLSDLLPKYVPQRKGKHERCT